LTISPATLESALVVLYGLAFTSELLHYYFDGFIWKVRHQENDAYLSDAETRKSPDQRDKSWWDSQSDESLFPVLLKQGLYFLVPIMLLTVTFLMWRQEEVEFTPMQHLAEAQTRHDFLRAVRVLDQQIEFEKRMVDLRPRAAHLTYMSEMRFLRTRTLIKRNAGRATAAELTEYASQVELSIASMKRSLDLPPPYEHREFILRYSRPMTRNDIETKISEMQQQLQLIQDTLAARPQG